MCLVREEMDSGSGGWVRAGVAVAVRLLLVGDSREVPSLTPGADLLVVREGVVASSQTVRDPVAHCFAHDTSGTFGACRIWHGNTP